MFVDFSKFRDVLDKIRSFSNHRFMLVTIRCVVHKPWHEKKKVHVPAKIPAAYSALLRRTVSAVLAS